MKIVERIRLGSRGQGSLLKYAGSANWAFSYYQSGQEHRVTNGTDDLKAAKRFAKQRRDEVGADRQGLQTLFTPLRARVTVNELLDAYVEDLTLREVKSLYKTTKHMQPIRAHFGPMRATAVTAERVDHYVTLQQQAGKANSAINRGLTSLATAFQVTRRGPCSIGTRSRPVTT